MYANMRHQFARTIAKNSLERRIEDNTRRHTPARPFQQHRKSTLMTANTTSQGAQDLMTLSASLSRYLPLAAARWGLGQRDEKATADAAWKVYDASVRVATMAIDTLYRTPLFRETVSSTANHWLPWGRMGNTVNRVFMSNFRQMLGLPTAAEIQVLTAHVRALETHSESRQHSPHRESPAPRRSQEPFVDGVARNERKKERPREARTGA